MTEDQLNYLVSHSHELEFEDSIYIEPVDCTKQGVFCVFAKNAELGRFFIYWLYDSFEDMLYYFDFYTHKDLDGAHLYEGCPVDIYDSNEVTKFLNTIPKNALKNWISGTLPGHVSIVNYKAPKASFTEITKPTT